MRIVCRVSETLLGHAVVRMRRMRHNEQSWRRAALALMIMAMFAASAADASTIVIDFEEPEFDHGDVVTSSKGVIITTENFHKNFHENFHPDLGVIFDSTLRGTRDPDLEGPSPTDGVTWSGGNLPEDVVLGNLLIIQENSYRCSDGTCNKPDDQAGSSEVGAGEFTFDFSEYTDSDLDITSFGFDFVDLESAEAMSSVVFVQGSTEIERYFVSFPGVDFGDNTANHFASVLATDLGLTSFDRVVIRLAGSGAVDNITFTPIPEPNTALLLVAGIVGLARSGRRRHRDRSR
jgi:hypothetical protein